jgi:hypothetical protein
VQSRTELIVSKQRQVSRSAAYMQMETMQMETERRPFDTKKKVVDSAWVRQHLSRTP